MGLSFFRVRSLPLGFNFRSTFLTAFCPKTLAQCWSIRPRPAGRGCNFKLFSFYLIYKAIIETGIRSPYDVIFKELDASNKSLNAEIEARKESEKQRERLIKELQAALDKVKTLSGLLPICSHCKKIRDDKGYWNQIESFIQAHSDAEFSHGICKDCAEKYYPDIEIYNEDGSIKS